MVSQQRLGTARSRFNDRCRVRYRSGAAGELPLTETWPELWVVDPSNVEEAKRLVAEALAPAGPAPPGWTCPSCQEVAGRLVGAA